MNLRTSLLVFFLSIPAFAQLEYHSERIKLMDIEVLQQIMQKNLKSLEDKDENPGPIIKNSLELLLAQPDQSLAISSIFDQLKSSSGTDKNFAAALDSIVDDAIGTLKQTGKDKDLLRHQNTYVYILNNLLAEVQKSKDMPEYKAIIEKIRDADIQFSDSLVSHRLLNSMAETENPSKYASSVVPKKSPWWKFW